MSGLACTGNQNHEGGDGNVVCEEGTGAPSVTEGGDWGDRWWGYGDLPTYILDVGGVDDGEFPLNDLMPPGVEPPSHGWITDSANGIAYRRVTFDEVEANNWPWESLLVVAPQLVSDVTQGDAEAELVLPLASHPYDAIDDELPTIEFDLKRRGSHNLASFVSAAVPVSGATVRTYRRPRFYFYVPAELDSGALFDSMVALWGDDAGGVVARGATVDRKFELRGPYKSGRIYIEEPPPTGNSVFLLTTGFGAPTSFLVAGPEDRLMLLSSSDDGAMEIEPAFSDFATESPVARASGDALVGQCDDGLDNDGNGVADGCDFSCISHRDFDADAYDEERSWESRKEFGLFGDGVFCTENPDNWWSIENGIAMEGAAMLNQIEIPPEVGADPHTVPPFQYVFNGCYLFTTIDQARTCQTTAMGSCTGHANYPLKNIGSDYEDYLPKVWPMVTLAAEQAAAMDKPVSPISNAVLISSVEDPSLGGSNVVGLSTTPEDQLWGEVWENAGRSVIYDSPRMIENDNFAAGGMRLAHEIGHTLGLKHDTTFYRQHPGFMTWNGGVAPILDWDAPSQLEDTTQAEAWSTAAVKFWPRWSGFAFTSCNGSSDCQSEPPRVSRRLRKLGDSKQWQGRASSRRRSGSEQCGSYSTARDSTRHDGRRSVRSRRRSVASPRRFVGG